MANVDGAFGLQPIQKDAKVTKYTVKAGTSKIHMGTPVLMDALGTVDIAAVTGNLVGVAMGFFDGDGFPQSYYPGDSDATYTVMVADDPTQEFIVQEDSVGGALALTDIGLNSDAAAGTGNDSTGRSAWELDSSKAATTNTLQLRILRLHDVLDNAVGDNAIWVVRINAHFQAQTTGI